MSDVLTILNTDFMLFTKILNGYRLEKPNMDGVCSLYVLNDTYLTYWAERNTTTIYVTTETLEGDIIMDNIDKNRCIYIFTATKNIMSPEDLENEYELYNKVN